MKNKPETICGYTLTQTEGAADYPHAFGIRKDTPAPNTPLPYNGAKSGVFYIHKYPTSNCQMSAIGTAASLLYVVSDRKDIQAIIKKSYEMIKYIPKIILIDVRSEWIKQVKEVFNVLTETPYKSTNGSDMCLFLVKLD